MNKDLSPRTRWQGWTIVEMNKREKGSIEKTIQASVGEVRLIPADGVFRESGTARRCDADLAALHLYPVGEMWNAARRIAQPKTALGVTGRRDG